jgi:hypothetical protein
VAEKLRRLAALRQLGRRMGAIETQRQQRIKDGETPPEVDRDAAQLALTDVVTFFLDYEIESEPLVRLLNELAALSAGASTSAMIAPAPTRHRRPDTPAVEGIKGRLAAVMEFRQQAGLTRKQAAEWVIRHLPPKMKRRFGSISWATVESWLVKSGGESGAVAGSGREGYLSMRRILVDQRPTELDLKKTFDVLARSFPS